ncbi:uncharacterized protein F5Z01DRAFT_344049 [Emericellopsis atlantica]|uniref:Bactericidal permeability-increasing protein n=1 Tax=Emericellopsis atlantica TaxID=2614577 RepID=A0A9P7ZFF1_9HYPO|nr:uncharacterized protein F5Z01DRAFT_344049 [Emericellopsis atlantica]KAG9250716.1 hypothetical protein F5Z01DRAFT_344049 [Emericellopsis atlantica]
MLSCLGFGGGNSRDSEREPLLPRYNDDTALQARLHEKLHTYQMLRAMSKGYMPSNEQTIVHLRTLLSADVLNPDVPDLSDSGRALLRTTKLLLQQLITLLQNKNSEDQIQDFLWCLAKARLNVDTEDLAARASAAKAKGDTAAAYESLRTVGSLLLTNSDFRVFLSDVETVAREVFRDTAFSLADVSKKAGKKLEPSEEDQKAVQQANGNSKAPPTKEDLAGEAKEVTQILAQGASEVAHDAGDSVVEHATGEEQEALVTRLKAAVMKLRKKPDYSQSVSTLSTLLRRYLLAYSHAATEAVDAVEDDVDRNPEADRALKNFWMFLTSIGDKDEWNKVEDAFKAVVEDGKSDPDFDELVRNISNMVQDMLADPDFFDHVDERLNEVRTKSKKLQSDSNMSEDLSKLLNALHAAFQSFMRDTDVHKLLRTSTRLAHLLSPTGQYTNGALITDSVNVFVPMAINAVQYIPIPRVEVSTPAVDLLMENLILEPGRTVNQSSFLPFQLNITTQNDIQVRKARMRVASTMRSLVRVKISGMSIAADDLGYWLRLHSGLLRVMDEGIAGFHLDERGLDIAVDLEIGRDRMDSMVALRGVTVKIHHLNYTLSQSKFACLAWLFKPLVRPIVRKALEFQISKGITEGLETLNRELLYARERLRATRIADPQDLWTFVKAVAARLTPAPDPDVDARVGVKPGGGVFRGRYAPGSLVKLWEEEGRNAEQQVYEYERQGWRNGIFDVTTTGI